MITYSRGIQIRHRGHLPRVQGADLGAGSVVAVAALVHARTAVPDESFVPPHTA